MSLARTCDAPLITAAIAVAPHPLPRSKTDRPLTTRGLSKIYLKRKTVKAMNKMIMQICQFCITLRKSSCHTCNEAWYLKNTCAAGT